MVLGGSCISDKMRHRCINCFGRREKHANIGYMLNECNFQNWFRGNYAMYYDLPAFHFNVLFVIQHCVTAVQI